MNNFKKIIKQGLIHNIESFHALYPNYVYLMLSYYLFLNTSFGKMTCYCSVLSFCKGYKGFVCNKVNPCMF